MAWNGTTKIYVTCLSLVVICAQKIVIPWSKQFETDTIDLCNILSLYSQWFCWLVDGKIQSQ